ncbi:MAG: DUF885 domain-containing protein [Bryobacteraceae bacterium]|jgi:uncharacterized protein (DUF885 family)
MLKWSGVAVLACALALVSCKRREHVDFEQVRSDFVLGSLALSPVSATQQGYHFHQRLPLDEMIDDFSQPGMRGQHQFFERFRDRLARTDPDSLSPEDRADYEIIRDQIALALLELDSIQNWRHNPTLYVETAGNALFEPYVLEYAPKETRYKQIIARLARIPNLMEQAKANLVTSPEVWTRVAQQENEGNIDLIEGLLKTDAPAALRADYEKAAKPATDALRAFNHWLKTDLANRLSDWRLGKTNYDLKFKYTLEVDKTPAQVLAEAEAELKATREKMARLAAPLSIREALDKIARDHTTPENYLADARKDLAEATDFVRAKNLVPLPDTKNLQVIETPEFMRGIYGVGGFAPAPVLEPQLGAFYWVTPIPKGWPKERVESKLREYNTYGLQHLTVHEAMPGHYVQFEYANRVEPQSRRLLRNIYGNTPYVEGWAFYTQQLMADQGYLNNAPGYRMTLYKQIMRAIGNAILDIRLHTMGMTDQQAMDLMLNQTFQEKEEATAKLQRAALSSAQLPCYFVGWKGWWQVRDEYEKANAGTFTLAGFHQRALDESAVPLPVLGRLLGSR